MSNYISPKQYSEYTDYEKSLMPDEDKPLSERKSNPSHIITSREEHEAFMERKGWSEDIREIHREYFNGRMIVSGSELSYE